ncbi:MAG: hypothetical protein JXB60_09440, partial [Candidatus Cloacimonetes bacterium]|nr:hypothetical protein [Candidatus Cloacimonadota bacterium]
MGKITVLMVLLIAVLLPFILTSGYSRSQQLPEAIKEEIVHNEVRNLGNYALTYAINRISTYEVDINPGVQTETFNNFNVLNGTINQITYDVTADQDTIRIQADITCQIDQNLVNHTSRAEVSYSPFFCTPQGVDNAITSTGLIEIKGSAEVDGNIEEQAILDFEEIFGYTKGQIRNGAT